MNNESIISAIGKMESRATRIEKSDRLTFSVPSEALPAFMKKLHNDGQLSFDMLCTHTAVDWPARNCIELIYVLYSTRHCHYVMVSSSVPRERPEMDSASSIWKIAEWQEREAYDMMGIIYHGHPDLRRILLEDDWKGFPLRKDYRDDFILELPK